MDPVLGMFLLRNPLFALAQSFYNALLTFDMTLLLLIGFIVTVILWPLSVISLRIKKAFFPRTSGFPGYALGVAVTGLLAGAFLALVPAVQGSWVAADRLLTLVAAGIVLALALKKPGDWALSGVRRIMKVPAELELFVILILFDIILVLAAAGIFWLLWWTEVYL